MGKGISHLNKVKNKTKNTLHYLSNFFLTFTLTSLQKDLVAGTVSRCHLCPAIKFSVVRQNTNMQISLPLIALQMPKEGCASSSWEQVCHSVAANVRTLLAQYASLEACIQVGVSGIWGHYSIIITLWGSGSDQCLYLQIKQISYAGDPSWHSQSWQKKNVFVAFS